MRLEQLYYFIAVCNYGSISAASSDLHLAQQTLSSSISTLEDEVGHRLLIRTNKGVQKTLIGNLFYDFARSTVLQWNEFNSQVNEICQKELAGNIRILSLNAYKKNVIPALQVYFIKNYPKITVEIDTAPYHKILKDVAANEADIAIVQMLRSNYDTKYGLPENVHFYRLFESDLYFWMSERSLLANSSTVSGSQLKKQKLALLSETDFYLLQDILASENIAIPQTDIYQNTYTLCELVQEDLAICPDIKMGRYGLSLADVFGKRAVTARPFKHKKAKGLINGYVASTDFIASELFETIRSFFNLFSNNAPQRDSLS